MKRGPSISKILDTRNLKALKLRFDVRAEHTWEPPVLTKPHQEPTAKRYDADLPPDAGWMK